MDHLRRARIVFEIEGAALKAVRRQLDGSFDAAVNIIVEALGQRGKIVASANRATSARKSPPP
jgi:hypothetical protein